MPTDKKKMRAKRLPKAAPSFQPHLTKTNFCTGVQCAKALYLKTYSPELAAPPDAMKELIFERGRQVGIEARKTYPGGVLIEADRSKPEEALALTQAALAQNPSAIFEGAFEYHHTLIRADILKNNHDGTWDLIEVKSSTKQKEEHIPDLAIQKYVIEGSGQKIKRTILKHLNRECRYPDLTNLFAEADCTLQVSQALAEIPSQVEDLHSVLKTKSPPV